MYLLALIVTLGCALASPVDPQVDPRNNDQLAAQYVLPGTAIPSLYDIQLFLDPGNPASFRGISSVRITAATPITEIVLHAMELEISSIRVESDANPGVNIFQSFSLATDDTHLLRITVSQALVANAPYTIYFEYTGFYAANMFGIYISTYQHGDRTVNLITSQLQPTFARRAFPCFDEPRYKAIFRTTIYAPAAYPVVRTNTNIRTDTSKPEVPGYVKHEFQDTVVMSSYLLAYLVSEFDYVSNEQDQNALYRVPFRVYARPEVRDTAQFALRFGQENMEALERYTDLPYALNKFDKVAVPDFAAGAMENWGLVIYREVALLVTEGVTTTNTLQNIGRIISHENMHMWFGNEVSPTSWTYTWLNEGFANFFENYATDFNSPSWRMMEQYILILQNVMQSDAVLSVNPMTHPVFTPSQIIGTFNAVAYQKSGSVIRMMQHFLTPEVFRQGLIHYLRTNSRQAVEPPQLYASLQHALDASDHSISIPIATIMERWTTQGGFPMLQINRTAPTANSVTVRQRRYLTDSSQTSNFQWHVPLNWVLSGNPNFSDTSPQAWLFPSNIATAVDVPGLASATWYLFNKQQTGYYRVNYEPENWAALAEAINEDHEVFHNLNRAQLLDDSFNLARTGYLDYRYPLDMSRYLEKEKNYIPWGAVNPSFSYLELALTGSPQHDLFRRYLLNLTAPLYSEFGFNPSTTEEHVTAFHRNIILDINCRLGNQDCIQNAQQLLQNFRNNGQAIPADLQTVVYCSSLRGGDVDNFNYLWQLYQESSDSSQQAILLSALGCTSNAERRSFYLNQIIEESSSVREQDRHSVLVSVINASPDNMNAALEFSIEQWPNIQSRVQGLSGTSNILTAFSRRLTTQAHRERITEFENRHGSIFSAAEVGLVGAIKENIDASIDWSGRNAQVVEAWLEESYGDQEEQVPEQEPEQVEESGGAALTASLLIISCAILAVFTA